VANENDFKRIKLFLFFSIKEGVSPVEILKIIY